MSIKDRLTKKTEGLVRASQAMVPGAEPKASEGPVEVKSPRTGPGQMLAFRAHLNESDHRIKDLESRLKSFDDALPVRMLDPQVVFPSRWANRHATSFEGSEFAALKKEIDSAGGNIQPIRVRPRKGAPDQYEVVFGHRRHQACLQLGLPVAAVVEELSDADLFAYMDRENRSRLDLSPFEQGEMYRKALDEGLFPSLRMLASEIGADPGNVSKAISIARLPESILKSFPSPNLIQYRWGQLLQTALQKDPEGVLRRALPFDPASADVSPLDILDRLLGRVKRIRAASHELIRDGKSVGRIKRAADGSVSVTVKPGLLGDRQFSELQNVLSRLVQSDS